MRNVMRTTFLRSAQMAQHEQTVGDASEERRTGWGQFLLSVSHSSSGSPRSQNRFDPANDRIFTDSSDS